ncbi:hypothetical protein N658DRAFT_183841 [Parathielavia hyrcaniae]|uniref:Uncharacterized protein n=1 Tax=Parathielavia hyrcaniae TaxID=113614 RepID=A0AAN6QAA8_9PEZI|nr:hypothetical protein N658DRAFT_183841 [Parathielavia hyrcaniae]
MLLYEGRLEQDDAKQTPPTLTRHRQSLTSGTQTRGRTAPRHILTSCRNVAAGMRRSLTCIP